MPGPKPAIGLDPGFTIHDREDSADLMNLVRHELGLSEKDRRFPLKATCLAIYSLVVPHRFYMHGQARGGDRRLYAARSRFIPAGLVGHFEVCTWPAAVHRAASQASTAGTHVDLAARMRGMWRSTGT